VLARFHWRIDIAVIGCGGEMRSPSTTVDEVWREGCHGLTHTVSRFEADPMGISVWRRPLNKSRLQSLVNGVPSARQDILKTPGVA
jgi:hypothetical protein